MYSCRCTVRRLRSSQKALRACWQADIPHTLVACASTPGRPAQGLPRQEKSQQPYGTTEASSAGVGTPEVATRGQPLQSKGMALHAAAPARSAGARTPAEAAQGLPIQEVIGEVLAALDAGSALVLQAPPGAGKTTAVPLALLLHAPPWLQGKLVLVRFSRISLLIAVWWDSAAEVMPLHLNICMHISNDAGWKFCEDPAFDMPWLMLFMSCAAFTVMRHTVPAWQVAEPRRLAAHAAARRMAALLGERVGGRVGFRTRVDGASSRATVVLAVTTGLLLRRLQRVRPPRHMPELKACLAAALPPGCAWSMAQEPGTLRRTLRCEAWAPSCWTSSMSGLSMRTWRSRWSRSARRDCAPTCGACRCSAGAWHGVIAPAVSWGLACGPL